MGAQSGAPIYALHSFALTSERYFMMYLYGCSMNMSNATTAKQPPSSRTHPYSFTKHPSPCRAYLVAPGLDEAFVLRRRNDPANHTGTKTVGVPLGPVELLAL